MPALATNDIFYAESLGLSIYLGIEPLGHVICRKEPEIASLGSISAPGIIKPKFVKKHHIAHTGICTRVGKKVA